MGSAGDILSLSAAKAEGFNFLRRAYTIRSQFVHGTWNDDTLRRAEARVNRLLALTSEAILEFLFRIKDGRPHEFPALDETTLLT